MLIVTGWPMLLSKLTLAQYLDCKNEHELKKYTNDPAFPKKDKASKYYRPDVDAFLEHKEGIKSAVLATDETTELGILARIKAHAHAAQA